MVWAFVSCGISIHIHVYLGGVLGLVPDHCNEVHITIKQVTQVFLVSQCTKKVCLHYSVVY